MLGWLAARDPQDLYISVVTLAEIGEGLARLAASRRRDRLQAWRDGLVAASGDHLIAVDAGIATAWGALRARLAAARQTISPMDGFIAATTESRGLRVWLMMFPSEIIDPLLIQCLSAFLGTSDILPHAGIVIWLS